MEAKFHENKFPTSKEKTEISEATGLTESQVSSWFARQRKKEKEGKINYICLKLNFQKIKQKLK